MEVKHLCNHRDSCRVCDFSFRMWRWPVIEVTVESVTGVLAIQTDSLYVFDQWCIAQGQSSSRGLWQLLNLFVNQTAHQRHPVKFIKTNLALAVQLRAPWTLNPWWINDGFQNCGGLTWLLSIISWTGCVSHYSVVKRTLCEGLHDCVLKIYILILEIILYIFSVQC